MQKTKLRISGTAIECNLEASDSDGGDMVDIEEFKKELIDKYGFEILGEGSFGIVLANSTTGCAIKILKDLDRCNELQKEKALYELFESKRPELSKYFASIPNFLMYKYYYEFCHINIQRLYSPLSGYGNIDDDDYGHGYVTSLNAKTSEVLFYDLNGEKPIKLFIDDVYPIDRPGSLIHFYINHYDGMLKDKLDNGQGILMGSKELLNNFGNDNVMRYAFEIGRLLSFLILELHVVPVDIEIVLATTNDLKNGRLVRPFFIDFNESYILDNQKQSPLIYANAMYYKNGKNYFPNIDNPFYDSFAAGFLHDYNEHEYEKLQLVQEILNEYNKKF